MKKLTLLVFALTTIFSCEELDKLTEELDKLTEFDVTDNFETTVNVSVAEGASTTWSQEITIDLTSNEEIQKNLEYIQNVTVNSISFEINNYDGAEGGTITEASINVAGLTISVEDINLNTADDSNLTFSVGTTEQLATIFTYLQNTQTVTATLTGTLNTTPVSFDVVFNVDATITIDVI